MESIIKTSHVHRNEFKDVFPYVDYTKLIWVLFQSTITKRHNYITVYEHDQRQPSSIRNPPNFVDPQGHRLTSYSKAPPLNASPTKPPNIGNIVSIKVKPKLSKGDDNKLAKT